MIKQLISKIKKKKFKVGIIGLGYVGLPLAARFINENIDVLGVENDQTKIDLLQNGKSYIPDINKKNINYFKINKKKITKNYGELKFVDVIFICLPTPLKGKNIPDMEILNKCIVNLKKIVKNNQILILESTVYPGATMELFKKLNKKNNFILGKNFFLIFSPERENPGDHLFTYKVTPKVLGGSTKNCAILGREIYKFIAKKTHTTKTIEIAEMSKLLENSYRSVNIGLVNEFKIISQKMGINIWDVIDAAKTKNFGFRPFNPGPGTGGHCIPIDPLYLVWASKKKNFIPKLISASSKLNISMPKILSILILDTLKSKKIKNKSILFIGAAYKKNVGDIRESPSIDLMEKFINKKFDVNYHDPFINEVKIKNKILVSLSLNKINLQKKIIILTTDHDNVNYKKILQYGQIIFDSRGVYKNNKSNKKIHLI